MKNRTKVREVPLTASIPDFLKEELDLFVMEKEQIKKVVVKNALQEYLKSHSKK